MNKKKCPICKSAKTKKNGQRNDVQLYKCTTCGHQFRAGYPITEGKLWEAYLNGKQTIKELAQSYRVSESSIKRRLRKINHVWQQPDLTAMSGFIHLDVTYWGHNWGVLLAIDHATNMPLYLAFVKSETTLDYKIAVDTITKAGYSIRGVIIDGKRALFDEFRMYPIQMCQFHMYQIVERYLTKNPRMIASRELLDMCRLMYCLEEDMFLDEYHSWKDRFREFINKRTVHKDGKTYYLHKKLRTAINSLEFYLPYLFTYQRDKQEGMPNTNNKIEGTFTDLKKNLNNHSGMSIENRVRFISGYFMDKIYCNR